MEHPDKDVRLAILRLDDALCSWERSTGRQSVLIIREQGGFVFRSMSGKPGVPDDIPDTHLVKIIEQA
jgi:hypothetical protein